MIEKPLQCCNLLKIFSVPRFGVMCLFSLFFLVHSTPAKFEFGFLSQGSHVIIVTSSLRKIPFSKMSSAHSKTKSRRFQIRFSVFATD